MTRSAETGINLANSIIGMVHLMYNKQTAKRVLKALIDRLSAQVYLFD